MLLRPRHPCDSPEVRVGIGGYTEVAFGTCPCVVGGDAFGEPPHAERLMAIHVAKMTPNFRHPNGLVMLPCVLTHQEDSLSSPGDVHRYPQSWQPGDRFGWREDAPDSPVRGVAPAAPRQACLPGTGTPEVSFCAAVRSASGTVLSPRSQCSVGARQQTSTCRSGQGNLPLTLIVISWASRMRVP